MTVHAHSVESYHDSTPDFSRRAASIYWCVSRHGRMTDRQILEALFPGTDDTNKVRPRVTELIDDDWLEECGETTDPKTGKKVRLVRTLTAQQRAKKIAARIEAAKHGQVDLL